MYVCMYVQIWAGGTLRGKADFNALKELFLDSAFTQKSYSSNSVRNIQSLAKLVNKGSQHTFTHTYIHTYIHTCVYEP